VLVSVPTNAQHIERIFSCCFFARYRTRLQGGGEEPLYRPAAGGEDAHVIIYRHDYVASALHEVAHWCIAGPRRRRLVDYGYWYAPDGRSPAQQRAFERVEVEPQALEWVFAEAWGSPFVLSADNVEGHALPSETFERSVREQKERYSEGALRGRAKRFRDALREFRRDRRSL
jgi:elongation factor P hydroxylase